MSDLLTRLRSSDCEIEKQFPMCRYITLKVGGIAEAVVYPPNISEFINILNTVYDSGNNFIILGAGSNTIIQDTGYKGVVISTKKTKEFYDFRQLCSCRMRCHAIHNNEKHSEGKPYRF